MNPRSAIATTTIIGATAITVGDAPDWRIEPYIGLLAAMTGVAVISSVSPDLAVAMSGLIAVVMILQRGERLVAVVTNFTGGQPSGGSYGFGYGGGGGGSTQK